MSKPKDPVIAVINYFDTADLPLAVQTLAIASAIVKRRQPKSGKPTVSKPKKPVGADTVAGSTM